MSMSRLLILAPLLLATTSVVAQESSFVTLGDGQAAKPLFSSIFDVAAPTGKDSSIEILRDDNGMVLVAIRRQPMETVVLPVAEPIPESIDPRTILPDAMIQNPAIATPDPADRPATPTAGNDVYDIADAMTVIVDDGGWDTLRSSISRDLADFPGIENIVLTGNADIDAVGDVKANRLMGNAGANRLEGLGGADILMGGDGDDTYVLAGATNDIIEDTDGNDTIESTIARDLADFPGIDNLVLTHSANVDGFGDDGPNRLTGNAGTNTLDGRDSDDVLDGGPGPDILIGGSGNDIFVLSAAIDSKTAAGHRDVIVDFEAGKDRIDLSALAVDHSLLFIDTDDFSGKPGEVRWFKRNKDYLILEIDLDGDAVADTQIEIAPVRKITAADLILAPTARV